MTPFVFLFIHLNPICHHTAFNLSLFKILDLIINYLNFFVLVIRKMIFIILL